MSEALYNSRIIDYYVRLVTSRYRHVNINDLLDHAGMKAYEVADQGHWFTQDQIDLFYEKLVQLTGNDKIAREAGRYAASPAALGIMRQYALGMIGPANTFELINKATTNFTRSSIYESRKISPNKVEIVVTPHAETSEKQFQCENRIGFFEALVVVFGFKLPQIEHPECIFKGGQACRYIITWEKSLSVYLRRVGVFVSLLFASVTLVLIASGLWNLLEFLLPVFVSMVCLLATFVSKIEKNEMKNSLESTRESTEKLIEQINYNYNNALMNNEIGQVLNTSTNRDEILSGITRIMAKRLDYDRGVIFLANSDHSKLIPKAGYGYSDDQNSLLEATSFNLNKPQSQGIFAVSFREQKPFLINDLNDIEKKLSPQSLEFARKVGTKSFICCPIVCEEKSIGLIAVDNVNTKRPLVQSDISRLIGMASVIGISIRNAELIESRVRQFNSVLQVLAASIDARDSLTAGHSEMVTGYSVGICRELELSADDCEAIRVAALLHDYGKIGVPDAILKKEGILSREEYAIVKTHASKTKEILSRIDFEGIYRDVPRIAGAHHEKFDGSGYPDGLAGNEIPLGARIIAVADYFEAITAKRHYREPMRIEDAFQALFDEGDRSFDKRIVEAFLGYYSKANQLVPQNLEELTRFSEQRRYRLPARLPVSFRVNGRLFFGRSEDISMRGIFVASDENVQEGGAVELSITLPDVPKAIEARGRIAWVNSGRQKKFSMSAGFGVELLECRDMAERFLEDFLSRNMPCPEGCC